MDYGWAGLVESGYTASRLTEEQMVTNATLRQIVENTFGESCN